MRFLASLGMTTSLIINEARLAGSSKFECSVKPRLFVPLFVLSFRAERSGARNLNLFHHNSLYAATLFCLNLKHEESGAEL